MAAAFDAAATGLGADVSSLTYSHTCGTGSNRLLRVSPSYADLIAGSTSISSVTYAGASCTLVPSSLQTATLLGVYDQGIAQYTKIAPATGANDVVVTMSESTSAIYCGSDSWTGVDQGSPLGTAATATGTNTTPSVVVTSAVDNVALGSVLAVEATPGSFSSGDTQRWELGGGTQAYIENGSSQVGAASVTMDWSGGFNTYNWCVTAVSLKPDVPMAQTLL